MRTRSRTDGNHTAVVKALRGVGCLVQSLAAIGKGVPDLIVATPTGKLMLLEVKDPDGKLTPEQRKWHRGWWRCGGTTLHIVHSPAEALRAVGLQVVHKEPKE